MEKSHIEEYVGAIYRLREETDSPLPLAKLHEYFGYSPISVHEMVQKLEVGGLVIYQRYRGVTLTEQGEAMAQALVRRHRIWERFLTDILAIPWDDAHDIAGQLEHAATELVTERLDGYLGHPETCPHGATIPPIGAPVKITNLPGVEQRLDWVRQPGQYRVRRISPEKHRFLHPLHESGIKPGVVVGVDMIEPDWLVLAIGDQRISFSNEITSTLWVEAVSLKEASR